MRDLTDTRNTGTKYELFAVCNHRGAIGGGHYYTYAKSPMDGKWRVYNDTKVYDIDSKKRLSRKMRVRSINARMEWENPPLGCIQMHHRRFHVSRNLATWKPLKQLHGTNPRKPKHPNLHFLVVLIESVSTMICCVVSLNFTIMKLFFALKIYSKSHT